jgi:2-keto-3-deoxy-6-phosphogluconate aldolase
MYNAAEGVIQTAPPQTLVSGTSAQYIIDIVDKAKEPMRGFLQRNAVEKVGGAWVAPPAAIRTSDWAAITGLAREAATLAR